MSKEYLQPSPRPGWVHYSEPCGPHYLDWLGDQEILGLDERDINETARVAFGWAGAKQGGHDD